MLKPTTQGNINLLTIRVNPTLKLHVNIRVIFTPHTF